MAGLCCKTCCHSDANFHGGDVLDFFMNRIRSSNEINQIK